jgi:hypothetical protein
MQIIMAGTPTTACRAAVSSLDSDGFTLNWLATDILAREMLYLALGEVPATVTMDMWYRLLPSSLQERVEVVSY